MPQQIKRILIAFAIVISLFLFLRQLLKPKSFGELGHYRKLALFENQQKDLLYAGKVNCLHCHDTVRMNKKEGNHAMLSCETCHGPALKHAKFANLFKSGKLPDSLKLQRPTERKFCALCHNKNAARKKMRYDTINNSVIKLVNVMEHNLADEETKNELKCVECHNPHKP